MEQEEDPQLMATKAQVLAKAPTVGIEFDPTKFKAAVTPEVSFPDELESLSVQGLNADTAILGNVEITGTITGLPETPDPVVAINDLSDVSISSPEDGAGLEYDASSNQWVSRLSTTPNNFTINDLTDVESVNPAAFSILQYSGTNNRWEAIANSDFVDAVIDGGAANSEPDYVDAFDLDGGAA